MREDLGEAELSSGIDVRAGTQAQRQHRAGSEELAGWVGRGGRPERSLRIGRDA